MPGSRDDPFAIAGEAKGKLSVLKDAEKWSTNVGHPGPANPADGEVFATFVIPNMFANAARGMKAETAVEQAELLVKAIFTKWREKGLSGYENRSSLRPGRAAGTLPSSRAQVSIQTRKAAAIMARVEIRGISKLFGNVRAVDHVNLQTKEGEFLVLLGPSGCGKTTLLRMIAGIEPPTSGDIVINEQIVTHQPPRAGTSPWSSRVMPSTPT